MYIQREKEREREREIACVFAYVCMCVCMHAYVCLHVCVCKQDHFESDYLSTLADVATHLNTPHVNNNKVCDVM